MPDITGITRDGYGSTVRATAPGKIADAIHDLTHKIEKALKADGVDWGELDRMVDQLTHTVTDVVTGHVNRHVTEWEQWQDYQARTRHTLTSQYNRPFTTAPGGGA